MVCWVLGVSSAGSFLRVRRMDGEGAKIDDLNDKPTRFLVRVYVSVLLESFMQKKHLHSSAQTARQGYCKCWLFKSGSTHNRVDQPIIADDSGPLGL